eukprot:SAG11_NODE_92_length_17132_cov_10.277285_20_plen_60_part_00
MAVRGGPAALFGGGDGGGCAAVAAAAAAAMVAGREVSCRLIVDCTIGGDLFMWVNKEHG